jgi:hypothetical protein
MKTLLALALTGALLPGIVQAQEKGCSVMSIHKLHPDHPLSKAGLDHISVVRRLDVGLKPGDVVFHFPHGKMVVSRDENGRLTMPRRENIIPHGVNNALVRQEAKLLEYRERDAERVGKGCPK